MERGPDGILIEDMGFIDNLMLHGGVLNRGGRSSWAMPRGSALTDMTAFKSALAAAVAKLG